MRQSPVSDTKGPRPLVFLQVAEETAWALWTFFAQTPATR